MRGIRVKIIYPVLALLISLAAPSIARADQYIVGFETGSLGAFATSGLQGLSNPAPTFTIDVPHKQAEQALAAWRIIPGVQFIEPNQKIKVAAVNDPELPNQWWVDDIAAQTAWDSGASTGKVVVAVIDSGLKTDHEDLQSQLWSNTAEANGVAGVDDDGNGYVDDVNGWNWVGNSAAITDPLGHGTHVAGILGAQSNNSKGIAGMAPNVSIMPLRTIGADGTGSLANAVAAMRYAINKKVNIINCSWGFNTKSKAMNDAIEAAKAAGIIVVAAAGNGEGNPAAGVSIDRTSKFYFPASYTQDNVVGVAATNQSGNDLASFSNFGPASVDIAAPGVNVRSTSNSGGYGDMSGTSMSAPMVSGALAWLWGTRTYASYQTIRSAVLEHANTLSVLKGKIARSAKLNLSSAWTWLQTVPVLPNNTAIPTITRKGDALTCSQGSWTGGSTNKYEYAWFAGTSTQPFSTFNIATIGDDQWGKDIVCKVTARNISGSSTATSAASNFSLPAPVNTILPRHTGYHGVERKVTCSTGAWVHGPITYTYAWAIGGVQAAGETGSSYQLKSTDRNKTIQCTLKATNATGSVTVAVAKPDIIKWETDNTPPVAPTVAQPSAYSNTTTISIPMKGESPKTLFKCALDSGQPTTCTSTIGPLSEGNHTLAVTQMDLAGNVSPAKSVSWTSDYTKPDPPQVSATLPSGNSFNTSQKPVVKDRAATAAYTGTEGGAKLRCRFDDEKDYKPCSAGNKQLLALKDRIHKLYVQQSDLAGNWSDPAILEWVVDNSPPAQPVVTAQPTAVSNFLKGSISFNGTEDNSSFVCSLDGAEFSECTSPYRYEGLALGPHTVAIKQIDLAGNASAARTVSWTIAEPDLTPPLAPIFVVKPNALTKSTSASFTWTGEAKATAECLLDDDAADYQPCTPPFQTSGLTEGDHNLKVRLTDESENVGDPAQYDWTVDLTPPGSPEMASGPKLYSNSDTIAFEFTGEEGATFQCKLNSATSYTTCAASYKVTKTHGATHTMRVKQTDVAGNQTADSDALVYTWTIDTQAPVAPAISTQPDAFSNQAQPGFEFNGETDATFECSVDSTTVWADCTGGTWTPDNVLADGSHTFRVRQTDLAGNTGAAGAYTWTVDTTAPVPSISAADSESTNIPADSISAAAELNITAGSNELSSFDCSLDGSPVSCPDNSSRTTSYTHNLADPDLGTHTFSVTATDRAGNTADTTFSWTSTVPKPKIAWVNAPSNDGTGGDTSDVVTDIDYVSSFIRGNRAYGSWKNTRTNATGIDSWECSFNNFTTTITKGTAFGVVNNCSDFANNLAGETVGPITFDGGGWYQTCVPAGQANWTIYVRGHNQAGYSNTISKRLHIKCPPETMTSSASTDSFDSAGTFSWSANANQGGTVTCAYKTFSYGATPPAAASTGWTTYTGSGGCGGTGTSGTINDTISSTPSCKAYLFTVTALDGSSTASSVASRCRATFAYGMSNANAYKNTGVVSTTAAATGWNQASGCLNSTIDGRIKGTSGTGYGTLAGSSMPASGPTTTAGLYVAMGSCPANYFGVAYSDALYNWGDDITYKLYVRNNNSYVKVMLADSQLVTTNATTVQSGQIPASLGRNTPVTMGYGTGSNAPGIATSSTAYKTCTLNQHSDKRNAGTIVYLTLMGRVATLGTTSTTAGGYFNTWSSTGANANTADSCS